jgi:hypothetical protein
MLPITTLLATVWHSVSDDRFVPKPSTGGNCALPASVGAYRVFPVLMSLTRDT